MSDETTPQPFTAAAAVRHGEMAVYYFKKLTTDLRDEAADAFDMVWTLGHLHIEAREAFHWAALLTDKQVEDEKYRQACERDAQLALEGMF